MQLKKWFVSLLAIVVSTAVFALPVPSDDEDMEQVAQQITSAIQNKDKDSIETALNKLVDSKICKLTDEQCDEMIKEDMKQLLQLSFLGGAMDAATYEQAIAELAKETFTKKDYTQYYTQPIKETILSMAWVYLKQSQEITEEQEKWLAETFFPENKEIVSNIQQMVDAMQQDMVESNQ
jgi:uncharacterized protein (DUF2342 family)